MFGLLEKVPLRAVEVFVPADIVKASAGFLCKSRATLEYGTKPPNDYLQIANLQTQKRNDNVYSWALCTAGYDAIVDEVICRYDDGARWPCLPYKCCPRRHDLPSHDWQGRRLPGLAWKVWVEPTNLRYKALKNLQKLPGFIERIPNPFVPFVDENAIDDDGAMAPPPPPPPPPPPEDPPAPITVELVPLDVFIGDMAPILEEEEVQLQTLEQFLDDDDESHHSEGGIVATHVPMYVEGVDDHAHPTVEWDDEPLYVELVESDGSEEGDVDRQDLAERATIVDEQMAAHITGDLLESETVVVEAGDHVQDDRTVDFDEQHDIGKRTARSRFPKITEKQEYLFSGDADDLIAAEKMRNQGVGVPELSPDQKKAFKNAVLALKKHMFTEKRCKTSERLITQTLDVLPKKLSDEEKVKIATDAMNDDSPEGTHFSTLVDAFVKPEVSSKPKPRPVMNHGHKRLWGIAKSSAIFEDIMFHSVPHACIKHAEKEKKMNELFKNCEGYKGMLENDMTAFEFGIHKELKEAEQDILRHIMSHIDMDGDNVDFCERVVDSRNKNCTWSFRWRDQAGAQCRTRIKMPRAVRESGDRITSSGNFLQNLLAWLTFLVRHDKVEAAVQSLLMNKGRCFSYVSARDNKPYTAYLAFEGDDTLGALNEGILLLNNGQLCNQFFSDYGWSAKLKVVKDTGYDCIQFVGYTALVLDNKIVTLGENVVMFPEIKRILKDKAWAITDIPDAEYWPTVAIYATTMMNGFRYFEPMYAFFNAMRDDAIARGGKIRKANKMLRDCYLREHGEIGTDEEVMSFVPEPDTLLDGGDSYYVLAHVHAGPFSPEEVAGMAGLTTLEYHGRDLACWVPASWLS